MKVKPKTAVALRYTGDSAPRLTAKGKGDIADQIIALANEHGIPLHDDAGLAEVLSTIELGDEIPPALYVAVAEVLAFAYRVSGKLPDLEAAKTRTGPR